MAAELRIPVLAPGDDINFRRRRLRPKSWAPRPAVRRSWAPWFPPKQAVKIAGQGALAFRMGPYQ